MPKKKTITQIEKRIAELDSLEHKRYKERMDFIESIQTLDPIAKAGEWLKFVANDIRDYGDQEALIYIASKGIDCKNIVQKLVNKWRESEKRSVETHFSSSSTTINLDTGKSRTKKSKMTPELYKVLMRTQPDFWYGRDYQEYSIDATMLRTVEWCEIGGFDEYWSRNAQRQYESIVSSGIDPIPAIFYVFNTCRSEYGVKLNNKALSLMLDAIEIPEELGEDPWRRRLWRIDPPRPVEHLAYAASLVFADEIIHPANSDSILIEKALNLLLKHQETNGAWKCWANDDFVSIEVTAMAIHALALKKPRGWELAVSKAKDWLLSVQDRSGYWYDEGCPDVVYLTVLVLDAIELASGGQATTLKLLVSSDKRGSTKQKTKREQSHNHQNYYVDNRREIIMGDKYIAGDNNGGVQYIGKFHDVITRLKNANQSDLADALLATQEAILKSENLSDDKKREHVEVLDTIGQEISKPQPNKTLLKMLGEGLLSALKVVPDLIKVATALTPYLTELTK